MKTKKSQQMSLSTVIIAALLLMVFVVILFIFGKNSGNFSDGVDKVASCDSSQCVKSSDECGKDSKNPVAVPAKCDLGGGQEGKFCCKKIGQ